MPTTKHSPTADAAPPIRWLGLAAAAIGLVSVGLSLLIKPADVAAYDQEDALRYQQVSERLHSLSGQAGSPDATPRTERDLRDAQAEFATLSEKLASARSRGPWLTGLMRYGGVVLLSGGLIAVAVSYQPGSDR